MKTQKRKKCKCGKDTKPHYDGGLYCGDEMCDECFKKMVSNCRQRSW